MILYNDLWLVDTLLPAPGVGFKSVFACSDLPQIVSGKFRFQFQVPGGVGRQQGEAIYGFLIIIRVVIIYNNDNTNNNT